MSSTILITGATGNVGTAVVEQLAEHADVRAGVLSVERAQKEQGADVDYVPFNFTDASTYPAAFAGVERLFLVRPPQLANVERDIAPALEAARAAGVQHIVFLSLMGVEKQSFTPHYKIEAWLRQSGMEWTFLRSGFFMQNLDTTHRAEIRDRDKIAVPVGKAKTSFIDVRDIARVGVRALTEDGFTGRAPVLTGGEALTYYQVADVLSEVLGRRITYTDPNVLSFFIDHVQQGQSWGQAGIMTFLYTITRFGNANYVNPDMPTLLGRPPTTLREYAELNREAWEK